MIGTRRMEKANFPYKKNTTNRSEPIGSKLNQLISRMQKMVFFFIAYLLNRIQISFVEHGRLKVAINCMIRSDSICFSSFILLFLFDSLPLFRDENQPYACAYLNIFVRILLFFFLSLSYSRISFGFVWCTFNF